MGMYWRIFELGNNRMYVCVGEGGKSEPVRTPYAVLSLGLSSGTGLQYSLLWFILKSKAKKVDIHGFHLSSSPNRALRFVGWLVHQGRVRSEHDIQHKWLPSSTAYASLRRLVSRGTKRDTKGRQLGMRQAENSEWFMPDV